MNEERHPVTFQSKLLLNTLWDFDQKIVALEKERDNFKMSAEYWERQYHELKNREFKVGWVLGSEATPGLTKIPEPEDIAADYPF